MLPSATSPHIPKTERKDILKIYGDAEVTVSDWSVKEDPVTEGSGFAGAFWTWYTISVGLNFSDTTNWPSYPGEVIPWILNGVSTSSPGISFVVVTVTVFEEISPFPARILEIPATSPVYPTIRNSSIFGWISRAELG